MSNLYSSLRQLFGNTVLHKAAAKLDLAELSLQVQRHPSDVNVQEPKMGWTPLHVAADKGFEAGIRELLLRDCKPDLQDKEGRTALHIAAGRGCRKVVEDLLKRGASVHIRDKSGQLAYDYAVQRYPDIAALLGGGAIPLQAIAPAAMGAGAGAVPSAMATAAPLPPQPAMPFVELISTTCVNQLLPTPPSVTHGPVISTGADGTSMFPNVHHELAPMEPLLLAPQPPPPAMIATTSQPKGLYLAGPGAANSHGTGMRAAPQPYAQPYESFYPQGPQAMPHPSQQFPAVRIPYPVLAGTQPQLLANNGRQSGTTKTSACEPYAGSPSFSAPPQPPPPFQPAQSPPHLAIPPLTFEPSSTSAAKRGGASSGGGSGRGGMGPTMGSVNTAAADLDWGSAPATDWGDEPEPSPPPPVPSRPNFNPILSARIQLEKLMGASLSQLGIGPPRPAPTTAGSSDPRVNAGSTRNDPRVDPASGVSPGFIGSSSLSPSNASLRRGRTYSYEELRHATGNFSPVNKLGEGGFGPVYRGWLDGIPVAVKVMDTSEGCMQGLGEFEAEVNILSSLHHPHVVLLIGSCPEKGILVYELMPNGSLENHLFCPDGGSGGGGGGAGAAGPGAALPSTGPRLVFRGALSWRDRVRIAAEVASALLFLHTAPIPIVHMDMKPANILLDTHLTAKLGDVGLARLAPMLARPAGPAAAAVQGNPRSTVMDSRLVGTFEYMDPEYMQTAQFSARSDVYALGMIMLQMLTGKSGKQVISYVEAERRDPLGFGPCIDPRAGPWPVAEAAAFADLALRCVAYSRQDRPDLRSVILPVLTQLMQRTHLYEEEQQQQPQQHHQQQQQQQQQQDSAPPMFMCPITQEVMDEPVVAADGYTYEKLAITEWIKRSRTSPLTNLPLEHTNLVENRTLRSAIREWHMQHPHQQPQTPQQRPPYRPPIGEQLVAAAAAAAPPPPPRAMAQDFFGW
ncbi:hypothetical protein VaNZ11_009830 [Volvox africanus]|uniref:RING-type E3 ubiquitin transferase n=1 Tax=Volvox africanus TaxID=51714 RepID=A0ABQ5S8K5_9CHLO|nr:hypothetical protein VaNZ11_009830 [Volvox africanus]